MPTTITQGFTKFRSNLEITSLQSSTVSTRQTNVRGVVKAGLGCWWSNGTENCHKDGSFYQKAKLHKPSRSYRVSDAASGIHR